MSGIISVSFLPASRDTITIQRFQVVMDDVKISKLGLYLIFWKHSQFWITIVFPPNDFNDTCTVESVLSKTSCLYQSVPIHMHLAYNIGT